MRAEALDERMWHVPPIPTVLDRAGPGREQDGDADARSTERLTLVIASLAAGGAERVMSTLANAWAEEGRSVTLLSLAAVGEDFYPLHPAVRRVGLDLLSPSRHSGEAVRNNLRRVLRLRRALRASRPQVVISFVDVVNNLTLLATRSLGVPVIVSERTDPTQHRIGRVPAALRRVLYPRADAVVVQSPEVRRWAERFVPAGRVRVIPNPLSPGVARSTEARKSLDEVVAAAPRERTLLAMGRLGWEKGFDLLLRAFATVRPNHPEWSLWILGEGEERSALETLARELGIADAVHLPGRVADPVPLMRRAGLFVLPSRFEGFPNALLEAMACGLPVIAADCPSGPRQIVRHGVDGLLIPPENVGALSDALDRLLRAPAERDRLAQRSPEVAERFALGPVMSAWEAVLREFCPPSVA